MRIVMLVFSQLSGHIWRAVEWILAGIVLSRKLRAGHFQIGPFGGLHFKSRVALVFNDFLLNNIVCLANTRAAAVQNLRVDVSPLSSEFFVFRRKSWHLFLSLPEVVSLLGRNLGVVVLWELGEGLSERLVDLDARVILNASEILTRGELGLEGLGCLHQVGLNRGVGVGHLGGGGS